LAKTATTESRLRSRSIAMTQWVDAFVEKFRRCCG
jgi:hypothetical protein